MNSIRRWLICGTDFSERASGAANVAAKLALRRSEDLRLVHVSDAVSYTPFTAARKRLEAEAQRLRQTGVDVEPVLLGGPRPPQEFLQYIRTNPPTMVVVSSAIKSPLDRWALGSFSECIAESAPVPTLVVRNPEVFDSWDWTKDRLKVFLALDLYATSDVVLRWAKEFRLSGPCEFVACHINRRMPFSEDSSSGSSRPENRPAVQARLVRELQKKIRDQLGDENNSIIVKPYLGEPAPCIIETAREAKAQLVAVGTHQRHGLSRLLQFSVSRELLRESDINVVCVPVKAKFDPRTTHIPEFHRVLVATDFSELGDAAVPFACGACCIGGLVRIIHVTSPRRRGRGFSPADLRQQLRSLIPAETGARCQPPEVEVLEDRDPASAICAEAERFGADLVCLSSHGLGASRALHGSITKAVLKKIRRPLLVIRRPDE